MVMGVLKKERFQSWTGNSPDLNPIENCWLHMEEEAERGPHHRLRPQDDAGDQEDVGAGHDQGLLQGAVGLHA